MTGQSGMSCSTRGGPWSPLLLSNRTGHGGKTSTASAGIAWHYMALALALLNSSLLVRDRRWPQAKPH